MEEKRVLVKCQASNMSNLEWSLVYVMYYISFYIIIY